MKNILVFGLLLVASPVFASSYDDFYVGEWRLQNHGEAGAVPMITHAASDCPSGSLESVPAKAAQGLK
jgi:hypothetical protein